MQLIGILSATAAALFWASAVIMFKKSGEVLSPTALNLFKGIVTLVLLVPTALGLAWFGPVMSAIQHLVRPDMRATASAVFLFIINLVGIGVGTYAIGAISDTLAAQFGDDSLRYSILAGTSFYIAAAGFFLLAARFLERDWEG